MLNDFIGGNIPAQDKNVCAGDKQIHNGSFIIMRSMWLFLCISKLKKLDLKAALSKSCDCNKMNGGIQPIRLMMSPNALINLPTINAYTQNGLYAKEIDAYKIIRFRILKLHR